MTIVWSAALVGFAAMTEHGPPRNVLDSRSPFSRGQAAREWQKGVRGTCPCRESEGVPQVSNFPPRSKIRLRRNGGQEVDDTQSEV